MLAIMAAESIPTAAIFARARDEFGVQSIMVGFSGGKDACCTLDLCHKFFPQVQAYFLYIIPGLEFQESYLRFFERKYSLTIHRLPSPTISAWLREGGYRLPSAQAASARKIKLIDIQNHLRLRTGIDWFATGEKAIDSIERNAMIRNKRGIDPKRRMIWPCAYWNDAAIFSHLKRENIPLPPDYRFSAGENYKPRSFGSMGPTELTFIREHYPRDYAKIVEMFPLLPANLLNTEARDGQEKSSQ